MKKNLKKTSPRKKNTSTPASSYKIHHRTCYGLKGIEENSIHALITDPPYGISFQNHAWDKVLPDKRIWSDCIRVLRPGAFGLIFSSVRLMHRLMVMLEDGGFIIKDVLFWAYLNGMPKSRNVALGIDRELGIESEAVGTYTYVQGYKKGGAENYYATPEASGSKSKLEPASEQGLKFKGAGLGLKPAYEPIILVQKPVAAKLSVAQNLIRHGTGALNLEATRLPYGDDDGKVGHNPHPHGRVAANVIRTDRFEDGYDKFFCVPKVRQHKDAFNTHPTLKPTELMQHLVKLISFEQQHVLDPFMGSGSTGVASILLNRNFTGYELEQDFFAIANERLRQAASQQRQTALSSNRDAD